MRYLIPFLLGMIIFSACRNERPTDSESTNQTGIQSELIDSLNTEDNNSGIRIINDGPRGGAFYGENEKEFSYRIFRVQIYNDNIFPIGLVINFPSPSVPLLPDSSVNLEISVLPDSIIPNSIKDTIDFGIKDVNKFFESDITNFSSTNKTILPGDFKAVYIGILFKNEIENGLTRSIMFINGQEIDAPFLPNKSIQNIEQKHNTLNLVYGVGVDPPNHYKLFLCGQIYINKNK